MPGPPAPFAGWRRRSGSRPAARQAPAAVRLQRVELAVERGREIVVPLADGCRRGDVAGGHGQPGREDDERRRRRRGRGASRRRCYRLGESRRREVAPASAPAGSSSRSIVADQAVASACRRPRRDRVSGDQQPGCVGLVGGRPGASRRSRTSAEAGQGDRDSLTAGPGAGAAGPRPARTGRHGDHVGDPEAEALDPEPGHVEQARRPARAAARSGPPTRRARRRPRPRSAPPPGAGRPRAGRPRPRRSPAGRWASSGRSSESSTGWGRGSPFSSATASDDHLDVEVVADGGDVAGLVAARAGCPPPGSGGRAGRS